MSYTVVYSVAVGLSVLFFVGLYLLDRPKKSAPAQPREEPREEPPGWHKWFDDPV